MFEEATEALRASKDARCGPRSGSQRLVPEPLVSTTRFGVESPSPLPRCLVVKNGSNSLSRVLPSNPGPLSHTAISHHASVVSTVTSMRPCPFIAWAALSSTLNSTTWIWEASSRSVGPSLGSRISTSAQAGSWCSIDAVPDTSVVTAVGVMVGGMGLANSNRSCTIWLRASIRIWISSMTARSGAPASIRPPITCKAPRMPASGFFTSCATTAAISPSRASVSYPRSCASARLRSVISNRIAM